MIYINYSSYVMYFHGVLFCGNCVVFWKPIRHEIEEIRIRALNNIISKLENGAVYDNDLARSSELIRKLFEWFLFVSFSEENKVLHLLQRVLQSNTGSSLVNYVGANSILQELKNIQTIIKPHFHPLITDIIRTVELTDENLSVVPPLISDVPLSYRSDQTQLHHANDRPQSSICTNTLRSQSCYTHRSFTPRIDISSVKPSEVHLSLNEIYRDDPSNTVGTTAIPTLGSEQNSTSAMEREFRSLSRFTNTSSFTHQLHLSSLKPSAECVSFNQTNENDLTNTVSTTATIIGFEQKSTSTGKPELSFSAKPNHLQYAQTLKTKDTSTPYLTLNWQPLVKADSHVFKSVEETIQNPAQMSMLLNSCEFFCNVMLQDFPSEVFLQRPTIIILFHKLLCTCPSTRIINSILLCLNKLTENLLVRIRFYSDPCTYSLKPEIITKNDDECDTSNSTTRKGFTYNLNIPEEVNSETEIEDTNLLQLQQLSLPDYCIQTLFYVLSYISEKPLSLRDSTSKKRTQSSMNTALSLIDNLISLMNMCIKSSIWDNQKDEYLIQITNQINGLLIKLGDVLEQFRLMVVATDMEYFERKAQLHMLVLTSILLNKMVPIKKANDVIPRNLKNAISVCLLDASFGRLYPAAHESLLQYVKVFDNRHETESLTKYKEIKQVCTAMSSAIKFMKHNYPLIESLHLLLDSLPSLEFHRNFKIINNFLEICVKNVSVLSVEESIQKVVDDIILSLLSHNDEEIRKEMYSQAHKLIVNTLGVNHVKCHGPGPSGTEIVFFLRTDIFIEVAAYGLTSDCIQIQTHAEDILIHILKCKFIVAESIWKRFISSVIPALGILHCFVGKTTPLEKSLFRMMDPDVSSSIFMPNIEILKGNLRFLFCKEQSIRKEAASRLCWLLANETDANDKIPRIKTLEDFALSNIFQVNHHVDLSRPKSSHQFYQVSSLYQVMELLDSKTIEPSIKHSALTQVSVMMEDHFLHSSFLEHRGLELVLKVFHQSLIDSEYHNYPDSVIPCVTVLKNVCLHNTVVRQELSMNLDLYFCLLRALILHSTDSRMQQDGALLLCLLLFSAFVIHNFSRKPYVGLSLPDIVVKMFHLPFKCSIHWKSSKHSKSNVSETLTSDNWCKSTLRMHWNIECYGGINEIINSTENSAVVKLPTGQLSGFHSDLNLTKEDILALKASSVHYCCQKYLYDVQNATTHRAVLEAIRGLAGYITLWLLMNESKTYYDEKLLLLPWEKSFSRFLTAPPASSEDQDLLAELVHFLTLLLKLYKHCEKISWISQILLDPAHCLPKLLQTEIFSENRTVSLELLSLISDCTTTENHLLDTCLLPTEHSDSHSKVHSWVHIINIINDNIKFSDSEQFYNLAYLDRLLSSLVQITSNLGWCETHMPNINISKILTEVIESLSELLTAFHYGKGSDAASSFMGLSITRNALLTMNHILCEMQTTFKKNWEPYWLCDSVCNAIFLSFYFLWLSRDVVVRAAILQLLAGLSSSPRGATVVVENVRQYTEGIWETVVLILLDHSEASIVREQAALLLVNLCSHVNTSNGQVMLSSCHGPQSTNKNISPKDAVFLLLKEYNFFDELNIITSHLYLESTFKYVNFRQSRMHQEYLGASTHAYKSYAKTSSDSASNNTENGITTITTPSLIKNIANLLSNLLYLAPKQISHVLCEYRLIKGFFRCLSAPPIIIKENRELLLYAEILEMCTAICSLLTRSVLISTSCHNMALHTRDCLHVVISLLNPELFDNQLTQFLYLRNRLWCEIFRFIAALLNMEKNSTEMSESAKESYNVISSLLFDSGCEPFLKALYTSIESKTIGLQKSALQSLTSLLSTETQSSIANMKSKKSNQYSFHYLFDETKTPRTLCLDNSENIDPLKLDDIKSNETSLGQSTEQARKSTLIESYHNILMQCESSKLKSISEKKSKSIVRSKESKNLSSDDCLKYSATLMVGADLCKILLKLYEIHNWESNKDTKKKGIIIGALSSLLNVSVEAKKCALENGLLNDVILNLKNLHIGLSLYSAESLRKATDKKKVCPLLKEIDSLVGLITNFMIGNESVKIAASESGLADLTHKLWLWCNVDRNMLFNALKMMCTFTTYCDQGCQSLILTNPNPGSGPRKTPSGVSLLHAVINLLIKEMELISRKRDISVLRLCFHLLRNICSVFECRSILTKSNLLQSFNRLHPAITKMQHPWEIIEHLWLEFMQIFTFYPEGQVCVAKSNDTLELIMTLTTSAKSTNKLAALSVLRNIAFHQPNRIKLLTSVEFVQILHVKLTNGTLDEKNLVVSIIWALVANSQRSKIVIKCAGLDSRLQDAIKQCQMEGTENKYYQTMIYVLGILKDGEK